MQLGNNRVWDYVGDNFVHRLLQNKTDGKLVEGPSPEKHNSVSSPISSFGIRKVKTVISYRAAASPLSIYSGRLSDINKN